MTLKGSCLCGAVRYEIDRLDTPIGYCHCTTCRKAHAAPYAPTARVARNGFRLVAGEEKLSAFESSDCSCCFGGLGRSARTRSCPWLLLGPHDARRAA